MQSLQTKKFKSHNNDEKEQLRQNLSVIQVETLLMC